MNNKVYLGLDVGSKTIGIAISQGVIASPLTTLRFTEYEYDQPIQIIHEICCKHKITDIVTGYPISMNGQPNRRTAMTDIFITKLTQTCSDDITLHQLSERLTTNLADQTMLLANLSRQKRKQKKDSLAAQIILNNFLKMHS